MSETNMRLIDEQELPGSSQHEHIQMTSIHSITQSDQPDTLGTSPISPPLISKNTSARMGRRVIFTLITTLALEVAVFYFLGFLWFSSQNNKFWHWIVARGYLATAVTASSFILRIAIDLQAGVAVAMLAALMLESDFPLLLADTAQISKLRAGSAVPFDLLSPYLRSPRSKTYSTASGIMYAVSIPLLLATTLLLQLTSTTLVSDLSLAPLPGPERLESLPIDLKYLHTPDDGPGSDWHTSSKPRTTEAWLHIPPAFPAFAEYSESVDTSNAVDDTGKIFRALLPFQNAQTREALTFYSGKALVLDARVSCQRPSFSNLIMVTMQHLNGSYTITESVPRLNRSAQEIPFMCELMPDRSGPSIAICQAQNCDDSKLISDFWNLDEWANAIDKSPERRCNTVGTSFLIFRVNGFHDTDALENTETNLSWQGSWTNIDGVSYNASSNDAGDYTRSYNISASICFPAFWIARLHVELYSAKNRTEPMPPTKDAGHRVDQLRAISDQMGEIVAPLKRLTSEERGILMMSRKDSWLPQKTDSAHWDESADYVSDFLRPAQLPLPRPLGVLDSSSTNSVSAGCRWPTLEEGTAYVKPYSYQCPDVDIASIFTNSLATNGSAASALSTIMTILTSMTYYDQMPGFGEIAENVTVRFFEPTLFPQSSRGFAAVLTVGTAHCLLVLLITISFIKSTRFTHLGNHWQSISQTISPATQRFLAGATHSTDTQVKAYIAAEGREHELVTIKPLEDDEGRIGVVARKVYRKRSLRR